MKTEAGTQIDIIDFGKGEKSLRVTLNPATVFEIEMSDRDMVNLARQLLASGLEEFRGLNESLPAYAPDYVPRLAEGNKDAPYKPNRPPR